jgi:hypothetical protein
MIGAKIFVYQSPYIEILNAQTSDAVQSTDGDWICTHEPQRRARSETLRHTDALLQP